MFYVVRAAGITQVKCTKQLLNDVFIKLLQHVVPVKTRITCACLIKSSE